MANDEIYIPARPDFEDYPVGKWQMVCCDVIDCGWIPREFNGEYKGHAPHVRLVFQGKHIAEKSGEPMTIRTFEIAMLYDERAKWHGILKAWFGMRLIEKILESKKFRAESLIGKNAYVDVGRKKSATKPDTSYPNIDSIGAWPLEADQMEIDPSYVRMCLRVDENGVSTWKAPEYSAFVNHGAVFASQPQGQNGQSGDARPSAPPQRREPPVSAMQQIIAAARDHGDVIVPDQVFSMLEHGKYLKKVVPVEDLPQCLNIVMTYLKAYAPPAVRPQPRHDQPKPGQTHNGHDQGAYAREVANAPAGAPLPGARFAPVHQGVVVEDDDQFAD